MNKGLFRRRRKAPEPEPVQPAPSTKGCDSKDKLTKLVARQRARALTLQLGEDMTFYECSLCGHWHVGHKR